MNTKLHAVTDAVGRPIRFFMTAGQVSDYTGARALLSSLPAAEWLLGDRGYDADWFREDLVNMGITPCIPGRKSREKPVKYDKRRYKRRNRIEIMFGRLKDWRRVATRYDRCPKVFLSAIALAATVLFWLWVLSLVTSALSLFLIDTIEEAFGSGAAYELALSVVLAIFIYFNHRWAMILFCIIYLANKAIFIFSGMGTPISQIMYAAVALLMTYTSFRVASELKRTKKAAQQLR
jgi:transposase